METKTDDAGRESKRASNDEREKERGGERKTMGGIDGESKAMRRGDGRRSNPPKVTGQNRARLWKQIDPPAGESVEETETEVGR